MTKQKDTTSTKDSNSDQTVDTPVVATDAASKSTFKLQQLPTRLWQWALAHKKFSIPLGAVLLLVVLFAIPFTRYALLGMMLKQSYPVMVVDAETGKPVSSADVTLGGKTARTDNQGKASIAVKVGSADLTVSKQYYRDSNTSVVVPITKPKTAATIKLKATGRQVPIAIINHISGKPLVNALVVSGSVQVRTDKKGLATMVVPAEAKELEITITADKFNKTTGKLKVTTAIDPANMFSVTPAGKLYFLSNQSGKLDVVKTNLDGTDRKVVLAGTGNESKPETALLASRDWKYLALLSRRDGGKYDKLFLINTADDTVATMDEGKATFELVGWEDHRFVFKVVRPEVKDWQPKKEALKSFNAETKKLVTLDEVGGDGSDSYNFIKEQFGPIYVRDSSVLYAKNWSGGYANQGGIIGISGPYGSVPSKQVTFNSVRPDGNEKKTIRSFSVTPGTQTSYLILQTRPYGVNELYLQWEDKFYEYEDGKIKDLPTMSSEKFYREEYPTYLVSPSGKATFWTADRDGKLQFLVGDADGEKEKVVSTLPSEYQIYGWHSDDYVLVSKKGSELFIMPASGATENQLRKVTDYYRPVFRFYGYGGGYGGL